MDLFIFFWSSCEEGEENHEMPLTGLLILIVIQSRHLRTHHFVVTWDNKIPCKVYLLLENVKNWFLYI